MLPARLVAHERRAQRRRVEHEPVEPHHAGVVAQPGDRVAALQPRAQMSVQRVQRRDVRLARADDPRRLVLVVGEPVQHEVVLRREVREQVRRDTSAAAAISAIETSAA